MNAFQINKIVGAVLATALIATTTSVAGKIFVPEGAAGSSRRASAVAATMPKPETPLANLLSQGSVESGGKVAKKCTDCRGLKKGGGDKEKKAPMLLAAGEAARGAELAAQKCSYCHSLGDELPNMIGPNLHGVVGREKGAYPGYKYSAGMKGAGGTWTPAEIDAFLANPGKVVKGTSMPFKFKDPDERADIIAYLKTLVGK